MTRYSGTYLQFDPLKGCGLIAVDDESDNSFVHYSGIKCKTLSRGDSVEFGIRTGYDGRRKAVHVVLFYRWGSAGRKRKGFKGYKEYDFGV